MTTEPQENTESPAESASQGGNAVTLELKTVQNFDWITGKVLPFVLQAGAIAAMASVALFGGGIAAVAGVGAGILGVELGRAYLRNRADLKRELALYHDDIARVLGKAPNEEITVKDMRRAADEKALGDKALKPLKAELDHLAYRERYNYLVGAGRALLTCVGAHFMSGSLSGVKSALLADWTTAGSSVFFPISGALAGTGILTMAFEKSAHAYFDANRPKSSFRTLMKLQESAKQKSLGEEDVFAAYVALDEKLAKDIERATGKPYADLTHNNKLRVMQRHGEAVELAALTRALNEGAPVTALAFKAAGQWEAPPSPEAKPAAPEQVSTQEYAPQKSLGLSAPETKMPETKTHVLEIRSNSVTHSAAIGLA